jgi:2-dehydropantoate 2-reductase
VTVVVVGAGAIGLLIAGRLAQSAVPTVLLARPSTAAAITRYGMRIMQPGDQEIAQPLTVITDPAALDQRDGGPELAVLCVKGYDTVDALPALEALRPQTILTLQNGIGNEEILAERFGSARVISGAITTSVDIEAPGRIVVTKEGGIGLAGLEQQIRVERWVTLFERAGFLAHAYADHRALKWSKALLNMLGNATAAILDMPVAAIYADRQLVALERHGCLETLQVMERLGIRPINLPRYPAALLAMLMRRAPTVLLGPLLRRKIAGGRGGKPPSLHLDLARGNRRSEGEFLYGAVARAAARAGVDAPVNRALWETLYAIASGTAPWDAYRGNPQRLLASIGEQHLVGHSRSSA